MEILGFVKEPSMPQKRRIAVSLEGWRVRRKCAQKTVPADACGLAAR
jgi:hypothetical protein